MSEEENKFEEWDDDWDDDYWEGPGYCEICDRPLDEEYNFDGWSLCADCYNRMWLEERGNRICLQ